MKQERRIPKFFSAELVAEVNILKKTAMTFQL